MGTQHLDGIVDDEVFDFGAGLHGGGLRHGEQYAHLADHRAWRADGRDVLAVAAHFELAALEDIELAGLTALLDEHHAGRDPVAAEPGIGHNILPRNAKRPGVARPSDPTRR